MFATVTRVDITLIIAMVLFGISAVLCFNKKSYEIGFIALGLAIFALAFIITP